MDKPKISRWKPLLWGFIAVWEDTGWRNLWFVFSAFCALYAVHAVVYLWYADLRGAVMAFTLVAGSAALAWVCARLHRRANGESAATSFFMPWKRGRKGRRT